MWELRFIFRIENVRMLFSPIATKQLHIVNILKNIKREELVLFTLLIPKQTHYFANSSFVNTCHVTTTDPPSMSRILVNVLIYACFILICNLSELALIYNKYLARNSTMMSIKRYINILVT
jgi:hypothetical protein